MKTIDSALLQEHCFTTGYDCVAYRQRGCCLGSKTATTTGAAVLCSCGLEHSIEGFSTSYPSNLLNFCADKGLVPSFLLYKCQQLNIK